MIDNSGLGEVRSDWNLVGFFFLFFWFFFLNPSLGCEERDEGWRGAFMRLAPQLLPKNQNKTPDIC